MIVHILETPLAGAKIIEAPRIADERGWFAEMWNAARYREAGLDVDLVQHNVSWSRRGVLRGMHFQSPHEQGKLISVLSGTIFDAIVDVRLGSGTFGRWYGCELSAENALQLWVPEGFAHGFLVLSDAALVQYGCTAPYHAASDRSLVWNDETVNIDWPVQPAVISDKDRAALSLATLRERGALPAQRDLTGARA